MSKSLELSFNTQPPEGGWKTGTASKEQEKVSTHSRLKAAGSNSYIFASIDKVSTHSRLKAAGRQAVRGCILVMVSTHSRLKAAVRCFLDFPRP